MQQHRPYPDSSAVTVDIANIESQGAFPGAVIGGRAVRSLHTTGEACGYFPLCAGGRTESQAISKHPILGERGPLKAPKPQNRFQILENAGACLDLLWI